MKNTFHAASIKSDRIQRVIKALQQAGRRGLTTLKLGKLCGSTRPSSDKSEANQALRKAGDDRYISCRYVGKTENNRRLHVYKLCNLI
jgi:hypothetical protein